MIIAKRLYGLLALFLTGSAGLMAQTGDPFPDVVPNDYYGNMTMAVKAVMNGEVLTEDVVIAVYCGEQIRGKGCPHDTGNPGVAYLTVYGNESGEKLYYKVAVGDGAVVEVDPGFTYNYNGCIGTPDNPYMLEVPEPLMTTTFSEEGWATTCLPFDACIPDGVTAWNATGIEKSLLKMEKIDSDMLPANTPAVLQGPESGIRKWGCAVADAERIAKARPQASILLGTTAETDVTASSVLTLGHSVETAEIGFWLFTGSVIPANRAYIADFPNGARGFKLPMGDATGVQGGKLTGSGNANSEYVYNLRGQRVDAQRLQPGFYVVYGRKTIVRR